MEAKLQYVRFEFLRKETTKGLEKGELRRKIIAKNLKVLQF